MWQSQCNILGKEPNISCKDEAYIVSFHKGNGRKQKSVAGEGWHSRERGRFIDKVYEHGEVHLVQRSDGNYYPKMVKVMAGSPTSVKKTTSGTMLGVIFFVGQNVVD